EPVIADDKPGMAEVRAAGNVPIAAVESEATRFAFRDLAILRAADIFQPDPSFCGAKRRLKALASELMRIASVMPPQ
ncbi:enolase C-terminal domain-like protein, partial [Rhizobium ruizarguesonis]